jgi:hypothetical protein
MLIIKTPRAMASLNGNRNASVVGAFPAPKVWSTQPDLVNISLQINELPFTGGARIFFIKSGVIPGNKVSTTTSLHREV